MAFSNAFLAGMRAREARDERVKRQAMEKEFSEVYTAKPEQSEGFTAEQGDELRRAAESGQYDVGYDQEKKAYTVTPKADPSQVGLIQQKGVTDFLGRRSAGELSDSQITAQRQRAQAGIMAKYGDTAGAMRIERDIKEGERGDERYTREQKRWAREDEKEDQEKSYQSEREQTMGGLKIAQNQSQYNKAMAEYTKQAQEYEAAKATGKAVGVAPQAPVPAEYSTADRIADHARLVELDARHGRASNEQIMALGDSLRTMQQEGYIDALRKLQSGADIGEVAKSFNSSGKVQFDPRAVVSDKMVPGKDGGPAARVIQFKTPDGKTRTISALAELDAIGQADKVYSRFFQGRQDQRADANLGIAQSGEARAAARDQREQTNEKEERSIREALAREQNPGASPAAIRAASRGINLERGGEISSDFKPDSFGAGGTVTQKDKKGNIIVTKIKPDGKPGEPLVIPPPGAKAETAKDAPSFASAADVEAAAKAGKIKKGDKVIVGGRAATWQ